jgi:hypothetical protein
LTAAARIKTDSCLKNEQGRAKLGNISYLPFFLLLLSCLSAAVILLALFVPIALISWFFLVRLVEQDPTIWQVVLACLEKGKYYD